MISESELSGILETNHLLRSPKNAQRLLKTLLKVQDGEEKHQTLDELKREFGFEEKI
jgi:antitoxin YefM